MWADNETDEDLLGFSLHANLIGEIVTDPEMLPVTIGLFGDWGGGKSSILKILQRNFAEHPDFAVIYFNSWVFEGYEDAKSAILTSLLTELRDQREWGEVIKDEIGSLIRRVRWMKVLKSATSAGLAYLTANPLFLAGLENPLGPKEVEKPEKEAETEPSEINPEDYLKDVEETVHNVRSFRKDFQSLIEKTKLKAFVILIDDLDRCSPERVIENLEAVKLFLNVESTAFVVAADRRIVENAIRIRYSNLFSGEREVSPDQEALVTDYLEKLIQVPYTLPKLAPHEVRSYMSLLFLKKHLEAGRFDKLLSEYSEFLSRERYKAFPLDATLESVPDGGTKEELTECVRLVESSSDAITDGLKGNPRQIKRFLNSYWLRKKLGSVAQLTHIKDHILIKLMVLEYVSSDRFEELYSLHRLSDDGTVDLLGELEDAESIEQLDEKLKNWRTPRLWKWLKLEPILAGVDLRDYFWVSRSSVSDTLSGVRLLSHAMRQCVDSMLSASVKPQNRADFFGALTEDEQTGVLSMVSKKAMQDPSNQTPLESLLGLAVAGFEQAANAFKSSALKIGANQLNPGLGILLRGAKPPSASGSEKILNEVITNLAATETRIGRALKSKKKTN
ncbi:KAP family P-loop NTPase fold protein [Haloferula sargassicola]|uniref:KAP NTPase domain-containing protein n=1 Tax=Haloferula sargassicola TaxID=490096 RepID=A0ABP9URC1_9BACT